MKENRKRILRIGIIILAVAIGIFAGLLAYNSYISNLVNKTTHFMLEETMEQQRYNFVTTIKDQQAIIDMLATGLVHSPNADDITQKSLTDIVAHSPFEYIAVADPGGRARYSNGVTVNVSGRAYFEDALKGETVISEPFMSEVAQRELIAVSAPLYYNEQIIGVLIGTYPTDAISQLFLPSFQDAGYTYITKANGDIIAVRASQYTLIMSGNLLDTLQSADVNMYDTVAEIRSKLAAGESGHSRYTIRGNNRILHYVPTGINDWTLFYVVPEFVVSQTTSGILTSTTLLVIVILAVFLMLLIAIWLIQKRNMKKIAEMALTDELTGAPNLARFKLDAQQMVKENPKVKYVLCKMDVNRFKLINQVYGFSFGDWVLKNIVQALQSTVQANVEYFAKVNIDEFLWLHAYTTEDALQERVQQFRRELRRLMGEDFHYEIRFVSGYYYMSYENCTDIAVAIERANIAHRKAKHTGRDVCIYDEELIEEALRNKEIEDKMESALSGGEFAVYLQPKYALETSKIAGAEALVRWQDSSNGKFIYPGEFISLFEENGFVTKLDVYMFQQVCRLMQRWIQQGIAPVKISVNFSRKHLQHTFFVEQLCEIADQYDIPHHLLEIELTESVILENEKQLISFIDELHTNGFLLSMDDFGTGYSSLGLLKNISVDEIKIDRSFFLASEDSKRAKAVLTHVIRMAKDLKIETVAEGVESRETVDFLKELGCDMVQGYYFDRPMPTQEFERKIIEQQRKDADLS